MFSWLLGRNSWLKRTCSIKGVNFIDNFKLFWGHRQLFKLDGLHLNRLGARVLKVNIYFSLRHPSVVCANPLGLNGTHTPRKTMSDLRTSYQLQSHHVADTSHKDTDNTMQLKQPWTSWLSPAHRAHHMQTVAYYNSSKTPHPRKTVLEHFL